MKKELCYPFDPAYLLAAKKQLKRQLIEELKLKDNGSLLKAQPCKIAILGGATTDNIAKMLELFLLNYGIVPEIYESAFGRFYEEAVFENPKLEAFSPDLIWICTTSRNLQQLPAINASDKDCLTLLEQEYQKFENIWKTLSKKYKCTVIQNNFEPPLYRYLGNRDSWDMRGAVNFISRLNLKLADYVREHDNFYLCDINYLAADFGLKQWLNPFYWHMYKYALAIEAIPALAFNTANIIKSLKGRNHKGLVLDLDNTLWGGVIGDDGVDGIKLGTEEPAGRAFYEFQGYLKKLSDLGLVLAVDSKNELDNALAGISHPDSLLKRDDFAVIKANWDRKDSNFIEIARELNLLPQSLLFIDDNPAERAIIEENITSVTAPPIKESFRYPEFIDRGGYFEITTLSEDDLKRKSMYQENAQRSMLREQCSNYEDYLKSLEMIAEIDCFKDIYIERITQLINKSNQFNLTTLRLTEKQIKDISAAPDYITLYARLSDRFGDNGLVCVLIAKIQSSECSIIDFVMSCRVLKRDLEKAILDRLVEECQKNNITRITGKFIPSGRNSIVKDLYKTLGFELEKSENDSTFWKLDLTCYSKRNQVIKIKANS